jgi:hypothetical protein
VKLTGGEANWVEDLLRTTFGGFYDGFCEYVTTEDGMWGHEWRFGGKLGMGGKFHTSNTRGCWVSCYPEDADDERRALIDSVNEKLRGLGS